MNYENLYNTIQSYAENTEQLFVANIPVFVQEAETRIYNSVNLPSLRKNVTGTVTSGNPYIALPNDWLANYSLAVIDASGNYNYLLNKDVSFMRESYPTATTTGLPAYYSLFGSQYGNINELTYFVAPTPDSNYTVEMHYFYYPPTIVQGQITGLGTITAGSLYTNGVYQNVALTGGSGANAAADITIVGGIVVAVELQYGGNFYEVGDVLSCSSLGPTGSSFSIPVTSVSNANGQSWLGDNYDPALFYGSMREAMLFMKQEADLVKYYEDKFQEAMEELKRLADGMERGDFYRDGQLKINVGGRGS